MENSNKNLKLISFETQPLFIFECFSKKLNCELQYVVYRGKRIFLSDKFIKERAQSSFPCTLCILKVYIDLYGFTARYKFLPFYPEERS